MEVHGGYAGIRVPWIDENDNDTREPEEYATLNLYGKGTVIAIGGDAGDGGGAKTGNTGGGGGGGAGAGIGGNGGNGGAANKTFRESEDLSASVTDWTKHLPYRYGTFDSGACGGDGENCGSVNINDSITVYAYGGAGRWCA